MSISTDILSNRRATSAPRIRSNYPGTFFRLKDKIVQSIIWLDMTNRRASNDSPIASTFQEEADQSASKFI